MAESRLDSSSADHFSPVIYRLGLDIGSTTVKTVLINPTGGIEFTDYRRHKADVLGTLLLVLNRLLEEHSDISLQVAITGSAGMGISERTGLPFIQEMVASSKVVRIQHPECRLLIDIGGEDSKMVFLDENTTPEIRMNGNCAGGTGAFIDQMASLLNVAALELDGLAKNGKLRHPIASRCGVFAKTDVQNLINTGVSKEDIACSVFQAVAVQVVNSLARGRQIKPPVVFSGGPLYYFGSLRSAIQSVLSLAPQQCILPAESQIYPALGVAFSLPLDSSRLYSLRQIVAILRDSNSITISANQHERLFQDEKELNAWKDRKNEFTIPGIDMRSLDGKDIFLGIDAGSTTTKIVATDENNRILFRFYKVNRGTPIDSVQQGLRILKQEIDSSGAKIRIRHSAVTGYGENLIKKAFEIDTGLVETVAHYIAAKKIEPRVTFILDMGGQDVKAINIKNGAIQNIEVNEACSSGCGSFIETFANSLGQTAAEFGALACLAEHPIDLGNRCTVFMNSSVKQALRQGCGVADVSAGLAYSVIQNCLHKVLKIANADDLGDKIIVQGGTFKNPAVLRALEKLLGVEVTRPDIAEYMGAYGAAITARINSQKEAGQHQGEHPVFRNLDTARNLKKQTVTCKKCLNRCQVQVLSFPNKNKYFYGNRCERIYSHGDAPVRPGVNLFTEKYNLLLAHATQGANNNTPIIGIPMALNLYENFPFWSTFFSSLGFQVRPSSPEAANSLNACAQTIMSDNICYPAKLMHTHILDLMDQKVDRIFYPRVVYEHSHFKDAANSYCCPVLTGYPDVITSAIDPKRSGIPLDSPPLSFNDHKLLEKACWEYVSRFGVSKSAFSLAFENARQAMAEYKNQLKQMGERAINQSQANNELLIVLAGRPYHVDPMINHRIPAMISSMGIHVIPEDALPLDEIDLPERMEVADQWEYPNRLYRAAHWAGGRANTEFVQLNSFGCGPDAVTIDEVRAILATYGKTSMILKIDDISSLGSARLRIRSMIESRKNTAPRQARQPRPSRKIFEQEDRRRTILVPEFSPFYSSFAQAAFAPAGYDLVTLPPPDRESIRQGLKYANNDICYPAIITIGDIIKALNTGEYDLDRVAVGLTETGGQCRATNYVSLLKKAMLNAGYSQVPVISFSLGNGVFNQQPGFKLNTPQMFSLLFSSLLVVDQLIRMYHATAVREISKGQALATLEKHLHIAKNNLRSWTLKDQNNLLEQAIRDFNDIEASQAEYPKAGLVGEIYVKYNPFGNGNIVQQLIDQKIEVTVPSLIVFFMQSLVNLPYNHKRHIKAMGPTAQTSLPLLRKVINHKVQNANKLMSQFKYSLMPIPNIEELAQRAEKVIDLCNQAGEGWLLPGEILSMAEAGVRNIVCLQPFGCIANHVVAKGISNSFSRLYPDLNYLPLDLDASNSDANLQNRLAFFIHSAKESLGSAPRMSAAG